MFYFQNVFESYQSFTKTLPMPMNIAPFKNGDAREAIMQKADSAASNGGTKCPTYTNIKVKGTAIASSALAKASGTTQHRIREVDMPDDEIMDLILQHWDSNAIPRLSTMTTQVMPLRDVSAYDHICNFLSGIDWN